MKPYVIAADIGTQGTKAALIDADGAVAATAFRASQLIRQPGGRVEQNPDDIFADVIAAISEVVAKSRIPASAIAAIGLDGQMAGLLGIDDNWKAVTPYDSWLDTRCEAYMPMMKAWGEEELIRLTGCPVTYAHGPKILWWKHECPTVYEQIAKFVVLSAYIGGKLAGLSAESAYIDYTHLHFTGFANSEQGCWSDELLRAFEINPQLMPAIVEPWQVIGGLSPAWSSEMGLLAGTPIVAGCGDTAAATLGAGIVRPGQLFDVAGTASVLSCCVGAYRPDVQHRTLLFARSVLPDLWTPLAYINGGGQCLSWFRQQLIGAQQKMSYEELNHLGEQAAAGAGGLMFIPHFGGRVCPNNSRLRGSWLGLDWSHGPGEMYRSIMESIAYEYSIYMDVLSQLVGPLAYSGVRVVGGGANSALFNRIKADVLGLPYETVRMADTALLAGAAIAGYGIGLHQDLAATAERQAATDDLVMPDAARHAGYQQATRRYATVLDELTALYQKLE